jgi:hypothetical protein
MNDGLRSKPTGGEYTQDTIPDWHGRLQLAKLLYLKSAKLGGTPSILNFVLWNSSCPMQHPAIQT